MVFNLVTWLQWKGYWLGDVHVFLYCCLDYNVQFPISSSFGCYVLTAVFDHSWINVGLQWVIFFMADYFLD